MSSNLGIPKEQNWRDLWTANQYNPAYNVRAKYYPMPDGSMRLASVQSFSVPRFRPHAHEFDPESNDGAFIMVDDPGSVPEKQAPLGELDDIERATRRAKIAAFDKIACNDDMTLFSTLTFDPNRVRGEVSNYEDVYHILRPWLSNLVSRHGFKYVIAPERHKAGGIHFHMISSAPKALKLDPAMSAKTGRPLRHNGKRLLNVNGWKYGFSSAEYIGSDRLDRDKVAKYIFKYMGKQAGQKIGGRYLLSGGDFVAPVYQYGDSIEQFIDPDHHHAIYDRAVDIADGLSYREVSFI